MKRLNVKLPEGEIPEAYKTIDLKEVSLDKEDLQLKETNEKPDLEKISSKTKTGYNLKKIPVIKKLLRNDKLQKQQQIFEEDVQNFLNFVSKEHNQLNQDLLILVLQMSEDYYVYGSKEEREYYKNESIQKMILQYYKNDLSVLQLGIDSVKSKIKKSSAFSRFKTRQFLKLKNIFFFLNIMK